MHDIAVLIPCYNEESTIGSVVRDFKEVLPEAVIYVYDNNSTDATSDVALDAGAIVRREYMQGKGNVIRRMFREIDARCYIMVDGDDTYDAKSARQMVEMVLDRGADMVVGDRLSSTYFSENKRLFHNSGNAFVRWSINKLFNANIKDIMTGFRAFSYQFVKSFPVISRGFEVETEMSIHAAEKNKNIQNVICEYRDRPDGSISKLNTYSDGLKVLRTILRLFRTYKPMMFFGTLAFILIALGLLFMVPVLADFFRTGLVNKFPTLIVSGFSILTGVISFFAGMILETITWKNKQDFEMELIRLHNKE